MLQSVWACDCIDFVFGGTLISIGQGEHSSKSNLNEVNIDSGGVPTSGVQHKTYAGNVLGNSVLQAKNDSRLLSVSRHRGSEGGSIKGRM